MTDKIKITRDLVATADKMTRGHRNELADFLSRLDGLSAKSLILAPQRVNAVRNKIEILKADNCGTCPGLPSPQAQQMAINTARNIAKGWAQRAREELAKVDQVENKSDRVTKYASDAN